MELDADELLPFAAVATLPEAKASSSSSSSGSSSSSRVKRPGSSAEFWNVNTIRAFSSISSTAAPIPLSEDDKFIRDAEYAARRKFGAGADASSEVKFENPFVTRRGITLCESVPYDFVWYPGLGDDGAAIIPMAESNEEFLYNLRLLTLGLFDVIANMPVLMAGGIVLAALHRWAPPTAFQLDSGMSARFAKAKLKHASDIMATFGNLAMTGERNYVHECDFGIDDAGGSRIRRFYRHLHRSEKSSDGDEDSEKSHLKAILAEVAKAGITIPALPSELTAEELQLLRMICFMTGTTQNSEKEWCYLSDEGSGPKHLQSFRGCDIDLFIVNRDADVALRVIQEVYRRLGERFATHVTKIRFLRTENCFTFLLPWPYKSIQIIHRLYFSPQQVLLGFDLDCCCAGFDGNLIVLPRCVRALKTRCNLLDESRQSSNFEERLFKYCKRGFRVGFPGVSIAPYLNPLVESLSAQSATKDYFALNGFNLLCAMLYSIQADEPYLKTLLKCGRSDYGVSALCLKGINKRIRDASRLGLRLRFVFGSKFESVMNGTTSKYEPRRGFAPRRGDITEADSIVPKQIVFEAMNAHVQDRCDESTASTGTAGTTPVFTGSFHPVTTPFFTIYKP